MQIRIGTRRSELARWQAEFVQAALEQKWPSLTVTTTLIRTTGDKILDRPLASIGDKALFTKELEEALLAGSIDVAVHSLKDLPTQLPAGLTLGAVLERGPGGDVWLARDGRMRLADLPEGATIATGSLRRRAQLLHRRPDLNIVDLRGNIGTRLNKLRDNDWAGVILAEAGLVRLGKQALITERLGFDVMLPAVGQGALAVEIRSDDRRTAGFVAPLDHACTRAGVEAERAFLRRLEGGCQIPIAARADVHDGHLTLTGLIADLNGRRLYRDQVSGAPQEAESLGTALAETLLERGGRQILDEIRAEVEKGGAPRAS
ncbi:MAG: hydroxymethylbilane synthase [Candidatus Sumerlaeia bacterium]